MPLRLLILKSLAALLSNKPDNISHTYLVVRPPRELLVVPSVRFRANSDESSHSIALSAMGWMGYRTRDQSAIFTAVQAPDFRLLFVEKTSHQTCSRGSRAV